MTNALQNLVSWRVGRILMDGSRLRVGMKSSWPTSAESMSLACSDHTRHSGTHTQMYIIPFDTKVVLTSLHSPTTPWAPPPSFSQCHVSIVVVVLITLHGRKRRRYGASFLTMRARKYSGCIIARNSFVRCHSQQSVLAARHFE